MTGILEEKKEQEDDFTKQLKQIREQQKVKQIQSAQATRSRDIKAGMQVKDDILLDPPQKRDYLKELIQVELEKKEITPIPENDPRILIRKRAMQEFKEAVHGECRQLQKKKVVMHVPPLRSQTPPEKKPVPPIQVHVPLAVEVLPKNEKQDSPIRLPREKTPVLQQSKNASPDRPQKLNFRVLSQLNKIHETNAVQLFKFIEQNGYNGDYQAVDFNKLVEMYGDEVNNYVVTTFDQLE